MSDIEKVMLAVHEMNKELNDSNEIYSDDWSYYQNILRENMPQTLSNGGQQELIQALNNLPVTNNRAKLWMSSLRLKLTNDPQQIVSILSCIDFMADNIKKKFEIYFQVHRYIFVHKDKIPIDILEVYKERFKDLVIEYVSLFDEKAWIGKSQRNRDLVFVLTTQFLGIKHAPTKRALNFCKSLLRSGKTVCLINCGVMPKKLEFQYYDGFSANFYDDYSTKNKIFNINDGNNLDNSKLDGNWIVYDGYTIAFHQIFDPFSYNEVNSFLDLMENTYPNCVIAVGDQNPIAETVGTFLPVVTYPCGAFMPTTIFSIPSVPRKIEQEDLRIAKKFGPAEGVCIESEYVFQVTNKVGSIKRDNLGLSEDDVVFAVVGNRLEEELDDGFFELLVAINETITSSKFLLIGSISGSFKLPRDLLHCVVLLGQQDDVLAIYDVCDFYLNPTRSGGGLSAVEALSRGVPVITKKFGDVYYAAGEDFSFFDDHEILTFIQRYLLEDDFRESIISRCQIRYIQVTNFDGMVDSLVKQVSQVDDNLFTDKIRRVKRTAATNWEVVERDEWLVIKRSPFLEIWPDDWFARLTNPFRTIPGLALVGAKRVSRNNTIFSMGEMLIHPKGYHHVGHGESAVSFRFPEEIDVLSGGLAVIPKKVFQEVDGEGLVVGELGLIKLSLAVRMKGWRCLTIPQVIVEDDYSLKSTAEEDKIFYQLWGFSWKAPDLKYVREKYARTGLLWQVRLHSDLMPFEKYAERGIFHWDSYREVEVYKQRADFLVGTVVSVTPCNARVVDIGSGDGLFSHLMAKQGLSVFGVEPEAQAVMQAQKKIDSYSYPRKSPEIKCGHGGSLPFENSSMDAVIMFDVIEHLDNPIEVLLEASRVLKSLGRLVITTPAWQYGHSSDPTYHLFEYTERELINQVLSTSVFKVEKVGKVGKPYRDIVLVAQRI